MENLIEKYCGIIPLDFDKIVPTDSNFIFSPDPSFVPLNLYDFFGRGATVNSFAECYYYVELGFEPEKITIFDIFIPIILFILGIFLLYKAYQQNIFLRSFNKVKAVNLSKIKSYLVASYLIIQNFFLFDYVRTKAVRIPNFIDEYISLASNDNFFRTLDFNAGDFIGGSYSIFLTSGPISAVGGVIGWNFTTNLFVARIANFYWLLIIQILFVLIISKQHRNKTILGIFFSNIILILIPWWQGSLYMIGEFASVFIFINAIFLINKNRKVSILLFSISIFFGKLLTLLPFIIFYVTYVFLNKHYSKILTDISIFVIPIFIWAILINQFYLDGNIFDYVKNVYDLIIGHQSSGVGTSFNDNIFGADELNNWNNYDFMRLLIVPFIFVFICLQNKESIDKFFGEITIPLILSTLGIFLWFWLLNSTKWMRYSQHFSIIVLTTLIYLLCFNLHKNKIHYFLILNSISLFMENNKELIYLFAIISFYFVFVKSKKSNNLLISYFLAFILLLDISIPYFQKDTFGNLNDVFVECEINLVSDECRFAYENN